MNKKLILLFIICCVNFVKSQSVPNNLVLTIPHDTCLDKQFSIVFYVILDSNYTVGTSTPIALDTVVKRLNRAFKPICVSFKNCSTVLISNYSYGANWQKNITDTVVTAQWYTDRTINFYIPQNNFSPPQTIQEIELDGYTYAPPSNNTITPSKDVIVVKENFLLPNNSGAVMHVMGHFFGLNNTHDEINPGTPAIPGPPLSANQTGSVISHEFADGSNSSTHGDGLQDTEADTGLSSNSHDGLNKPYVLPYDNYMSFYASRCRYTQQQYNKMAYIILTRRLYLH